MRSTAFALVLLGVFGVSVQAAVIHVTPKIGPVLNDNFAFIDPAMIVSRDDFGIVLRPSTGRYIAQVDFLMTITDLQPGQIGFGNAAVNIELTGAVRQLREWPGWIPDGRVVDLPGPQIGFTYRWAGNQDSGRDATDLRNILIETAPRTFRGANDPRRKLGVPPFDNSDAESLLGPVTEYDDGEYFGNILIEVDSFPGNSASVSAYASQGSTYDANLLLSAAGVTGGPAQIVSINIVPEPTSLALFAAGVVGVLAYTFGRGAADSCYEVRRLT